MNVRVFEILGWCLILVFMQRADARAQQNEATPGVEVQRLAGEIRELRSTLDKQISALDGYRKELADQNRIKNSAWTVYGVPLVAPLGSLVAAIGGWIIAYTVLIRGFRQQEGVRAEEQKRQDALRSDDRRHSDGARIESFLVDSLKYFQHGIQERSIGIGLVEAYWSGFPRLQSVWVSVLANQAVYILSKIVKDEHIPPHEADNLQRIHDRLAMSSLTRHQAVSLTDAIKDVTMDKLRPDEKGPVIALTKLVSSK